jgi:hypothetical protein
MSQDNVWTPGVPEPQPPTRDPKTIAIRSRLYYLLCQLRDTETVWEGPSDGFEESFRTLKRRAREVGWERGWDKLDEWELRALIDTKIARLLAEE